MKTEWDCERVAEGKGDHMRVRNMQRYHAEPTGTWWDTRGRKPESWRVGALHRDKQQKSENFDVHTLTTAFASISHCKSMTFLCGPCLRNALAFFIAKFCGVAPQSVCITIMQCRTARYFHYVPCFETIAEARSVPFTLQQCDTTGVHTTHRTATVSLVWADISLRKDRGLSALALNRNSILLNNMWLEMKGWPAQGAMVMNSNSRGSTPFCVKCSPNPVVNSGSPRRHSMPMTVPKVALCFCMQWAKTHKVEGDKCSRMNMHYMKDWLTIWILRLHIYFL